MSCTACTPAKPINKCSTTLELGTVTNLNAAVRIIAREIKTGRSYSQDTTTDGTGKVTLGLTKPDPEFWGPNFIYDVSVVLATTGPDQPLTVTVGTDTYTCVTLRFENILDEDGVTDVMPAVLVLQEGGDA